jgi:SacI homology domain
LTIASFSYLLCITRREQVAQIFGKPIYVIRDVAILPLSSQEEADQAISQTQAVRQKAKTSQQSDIASSASEESGNESLDDHSVGDPSESQTPVGERPQTGGRSESTSSVVQDVIERKGPYGRFASQWFSRRGWGLDNKRTEEVSRGMIPRTDPQEQKPQPEAAKSTAEDHSPAKISEALNHHGASGETILAQRSSHEAAVEMLPKILRTVKLLLTSQSFYFSYDFNVTKRLGCSSIPSLKSVSAEDLEQQVGESSSCSPTAPLTALSIFGIDN